MENEEKDLRELTQDTVKAALKALYDILAYPSEHQDKIAAVHALVEFLMWSDQA